MTRKMGVRVHRGVTSFESRGSGGEETGTIQLLPGVVPSYGGPMQDQEF